MNEDFPVHIVGRIYWLPPHKLAKPLFTAETVHRALGKFTSDFTVAYTVLFSYSSSTLEQGFHNVRLNFTFCESTLLHKLVKNSEILIMDGFKVIAVCRNLTIIENPIEKMGDRWV